MPLPFLFDYKFALKLLLLSGEPAVSKHAKRTVVQQWSDVPLLALLIKHPFHATSLTSNGMSLNLGSCQNARDAWLEEAAVAVVAAVGEEEKEEEEDKDEDKVEATG